MGNNRDGLGSDLERVFPESHIVVVTFVAVTDNKGVDSIFSNIISGFAPKFNAVSAVKNSADQRITQFRIG